MTEDGHRVVVMISPEAVSNGSGQEVLVETKFIQATDEIFSAVGLETLRPDFSESGLNLIMEDAHYRVLVRALEQKSGVDVLSAPRLSTRDGGAAQIRITDSHFINGTSFETGPTLDITPSIAADGSGIQINFEARLNLLRKPSE
jgi:type II secretory pathway component GspD/PulD (secretin)